MPLNPHDEALIQRLRNKQLTDRDIDAKVAPKVMAQRMAALRREHPWMRSGELYPLARYGYGPDHPVAVELSQRRAKKRAKQGFGWHSITGGLKAATRVGFTALETPGQLLGSGFRALAASAGEAVDEGQPLYGIPSRFGKHLAQTGASTGIEAAARASVGEDVQLGEGFLPGDDVAETVRQRGSVPQFAGGSISPGRLLAYVVSEPGTKPYTFLSGLGDAAFTMGADPAAAFGGAIGKAGRASKLVAPGARLTEHTPTFNRMLLKGRTLEVMDDQVAAYLDSSHGKRAIDWIAEHNAVDVWRMLGRKVDSETAIRLGDETDKGKIHSALSEILGVKVREKPTAGAATFGAKETIGRAPGIRRVREARLWQDVPGRRLNWDQDAATTAEDFLRNANIRDDEVVRTVTDKFLRASAPEADPAMRFEAATSLMDAVADSVADWATRTKVGDKLALGDDIRRTKINERLHGLTRIWADHTDDTIKYNVDALGKNAWSPGVRVDGEDIVGPTPHLIVEGLSNGFDLPDYRAIRRVTSRFQHVLETTDGDLRMPLAAADWLMQQAWKPATLLRPAWPLRVIGDEQARISSTDLDSFLTHPISAIATLISDQSRVGRVLGKVGVKNARIHTGRKQVDVYGELFFDRHEMAPDVANLNDALTHGNGGFLQRHSNLTYGPWTTFKRGEAQFKRSWANELAQLRSDPIAQRVIAGGIRKGDSTPSTREGIDGLKDWFYAGTGRKFRQQVEHMLSMTDGADSAALRTREGADAYIDSVVARVKTKSTEHPEIMEALRTGELRGVSMYGDDGRISSKFVDELTLYEGPDVVKGQHVVSNRMGTSGQVTEKLDKAVDWMMNGLMSKPSNYLSRSPVARQHYWRRMEELAPKMSAEAQAKLGDAALAAKLSKDEIRRIGLGTNKSSGVLSLEEADLLAKGYAIDETKALLYDLHKRSQWADVFRLLMPFGEAWKEVLGTWGKLVVANPAVPRRIQVTVEGARGNGFFHEDPVTGEEVFSYPGTSDLTRALTGVEMPLVGRVAGLSIGTSVLPGLGPLPQLLAAPVLANAPDDSLLKEIILPFGPPRVEGQTPGGYLDSLLPGWVRRATKILEDPESDREFMQTVNLAQDYLASTGRYKLDTVEGRGKLTSDAVDAGRKLQAFRAFGQAMAPSSPRPEATIRDKDGKPLIVAHLIDAYRRLQEQDYETATAKFIETYGSDIFAVVTPKSQGGAAPTTAVSDWAKENPDIVDNYRSVYGYFAPEGGEFDPAFYSTQITRGERESLTPRDRLAEYLQQRASSIWRRAREVVGESPSDQQRQLLNMLKDRLASDFPGWAAQPEDLAKTSKLVNDLKRAAADPKLAETEVGRALGMYFQARDILTERARSVGLTDLNKAKEARPLRDQLRALGEALVREHPDFARVFDRVLSREMVNDELAEEEAA